MIKEKGGFIYMMSNWTRGVLYTGVTACLEKRVFEHKSPTQKGFTHKYNAKYLVYYEQYNTIETAIAREKEIKNWRREKKDRLVETLNPNWEDLSADWYTDPSVSMMKRSG